MSSGHSKASRAADASDLFPSRAVRRSFRLQPASPASHPKLPVLRPRRFGAAPNHRHYQRNPHRAGASPSRRGKRYHHTHSRLHQASRAQTLIRPSGVMRVPSSAPQPAAAPLHPPHPSPSRRPPSSGSWAFLFVFRDPVLTHPWHSTLPESPAATVPGRGRCALPSVLETAK